MTWATFWDAFTAVGTVAMAFATWWVIRQNKRQHQDAFRPICVLVPDDGQDAVARRGVVNCHTEPDNPYPFFLVKGSVKNIGCGPALRLTLTIRFLHNPVGRPQAELSPLGPKDCIASPIKVQAFFQNGFQQVDYEQAPGDVWELWLTYQDVFGNVFHTRHTKNPQQPWTILGKGDMQ
ncbi:MAG: hypothetical protein WCE63_13805 [Acidobacteriaceae bacterium]